jgi:cell division protein FtsZ
MVFVAAGMGGGTGTGAASVIARVAREFGILTVAVVTKPFQFEGSRRMRVAEAGIAELRDWVDTLLVIPNQNLFRIVTDRTTFAEAFVLADQVLYSGIACIVDLIVKEGLINLDLADVKTVLGGMGTAMMGTGEASGEQRAIVASEEAIVIPLLDDITLKGARSLLLSITGGPDLTLWEVDEAANRVRQEVDPDANIIVGATFDESLGDRVRVSIVASGMARTHTGARDTEVRPAPPRAQGNNAHDYRRRLSEVIDDLTTAPPAAAADAQAGAPGWRAPGDVYIQEGHTQLGSPHPATRGQNRANSGEAKTMPSLEDFPPIAQREYWGKTEGEHRASQSEAPTVYQRQPESPPAKGGLFRRWTGGSKSAAEGKRGDRSAKPAGKKSGSPGADEQVDLPVFFGRSKR